MADINQKLNLQRAIDLLRPVPEKDWYSEPTRECIGAWNQQLEAASQKAFAALENREQIATAFLNGELKNPLEAVREASDAVLTSAVELLGIAKSKAELDTAIFADAEIERERLLQEKDDRERELRTGLAALGITGDRPLADAKMKDMELIRLSQQIDLVKDQPTVTCRSKFEADLPEQLEAEIRAEIG